MKSSPKKSVHALSLTAFVLVTVLAGCSSEADEGPELEETTDASSPESTEHIPASADGPAQNVPEPRLPAVATENTEEGARATIEFFWRAIDHARLTGDTELLALVSHDSCEFCQDHIVGWQERYSEGNWAVLQGEIEIAIDDTLTHFDEVQEEEWVEISFELTEPAAELYVDGERDDAETLQDASTAKWVADLSFDGSAQRWNIEWLGILDPAEELDL